MTPTLSEAIARAKLFLLAQAEQQFSEVRHEMVFPRVAGFSSRQEKQVSDAFARAVLASLLLDIAELATDDEQFQVTLRGIARREADYIAQAKLKDRAGGWRYFPHLPELPPDLDSLAAALFLFARIAPEHTSLCQGPIEIVLDGMQPDGGLETWLIAPTDDPAQRELMERGINYYWGSGVDVEVCARFYLALLTYDRQRYGEVILQGAQYVLAQQQSNGAWDATWYWGHAYGIGLCSQLLRALGQGKEAIARAMDFLSTSQRDDGGWGVWQTVPLDTALAIWAKCPDGAIERPTTITRAVNSLLDFQTRAGGWNASPWIKMDIGRASGRIIRTATYQSTTLTTAFCLRSLLLVQQKMHDAPENFP